eukprot:49636_1
MPLIMKLIEHQLSTSDLMDEKFKPCVSLEPYGKRLIQVYFENKTSNKKKLIINYSVLEEKYRDLFELICIKDYQWIKIDILQAMFPQTKNVEICDIQLCDKIM